MPRWRRRRGQKSLACAACLVGTLVHTSRVFRGVTDRANFAPHTKVRYPGGLRGEGPAVYTHDPTPTPAITCACIRTHPAPPGQPRRHHEPRRPATRHSRAYEAAPVRSRDCPCLTDIGLPASGCPTPRGSGAPPEFRGRAAGSSVSL